MKQDCKTITIASIRQIKHKVCKIVLCSIKFFIVTMCIVLITYVQTFLLYLLKFIYTNIFEYVNYH